MYRSRSDRARKMIIGAAAVTLLGGAFAVSTGMSQAGESCAGLDTALGNNLNFIAGQKANPDALSDARIANRQAVVDLIQQRRATAGCTADVGAGAAADDEGGNGNAGGNGNGNAGGNGNGNAGGNGNGNAGGNGNGNAGGNGNGNGRGNGGGNDGANENGNNGNANGVQGNGNGRGNNGNGNGNGGARDADDDAADEAAQPPAAAAPANPPAAGGEVVCAGSTVTLSGEGGAPAASSGTFPVGTTLRVTNLDNDKVTTVKVASGSGSCVLLNNAAFEQVREPGKFLIRRAVIERVG